MQIALPDRVSQIFLSVLQAASVCKRFTRSYKPCHEWYSELTPGSVKYGMLLLPAEARIFTVRVTVASELDPASSGRRINCLEEFASEIFLASICRDYIFATVRSRVPKRCRARSIALSPSWLPSRQLPRRSSDIWVTCMQPGWSQRLGRNRCRGSARSLLEHGNRAGDSGHFPPYIFFDYTDAAVSQNARGNALNSCCRARGDGI